METSGMVLFLLMIRISQRKVCVLCLGFLFCFEVGPQVWSDCEFSLKCPKARVWSFGMCAEYQSPMATWSRDWSKPACIWLVLNS